jgi:acid stress-induced BolA-like protein IbaG/YrbA
MHAVHASLPLYALYFPAKHAQHVPPSGPQYPALQIQAVTVVCPVAECPEFSLQVVQAAEPLSVLYLPAAHAEHRSPYAPVYPALHRQLVSSILPLAELEIEGQREHAALPIVALYSPATHTVHVPPSGPTDPALHRQLVFRKLALGDCEFAGHTVQIIAPGVVLYVDTEHAEHTCPSGPQYPALQIQAVTAVCPVAECPEFSLQAVQAAEPLSVLYVPAAHAEHRSPYAPVYPALHRQLVWLVLPMAELEIEGQLEHWALPVVALYSPTTHTMHVPPSGPVDPALHRQLVEFGLPLAELEVEGQLEHGALPVVALYFPASQSVQTALPTAPLYFPAAHAVHVPPFAPVYPALHVQLARELLELAEVEFEGQLTHSELTAALPFAIL